MARPKGSPNKLTTDLKALIEGALADLGGQKWLVKAAREDPRAFLALLSRCIPRDLNVNGKITHTLEELIASSYNQQPDAGAAETSSRPH